MNTFAASFLGLEIMTGGQYRELMMIMAGLAVLAFIGTLYVARDAGLPLITAFGRLVGYVVRAIWRGIKAVFRPIANLFRESKEERQARASKKRPRTTEEVAEAFPSKEVVDAS